MVCFTSALYRHYKVWDKRERWHFFFYEVGESVFMKEKAGMENQLRSMLGKIHMEVENLDTYSPKTFPAHVPTEIEYPSLKTE